MFSFLHNHIDLKIFNKIGKKSFNNLQVQKDVFDDYRFLDIYRSIETFCSKYADVYTIESSHQHDLSSLLFSKGRYIETKISKSTRISWVSGLNKIEFLPVDRFWIVGNEEYESPFVIRLWHSEYEGKCNFEIASVEGSFGENAHKTILNQSIANSVYKNQMLSLGIKNEKHDDYGDMNVMSKLYLNFSQMTIVGDKEIVLSDTHKQILKRNLVDLYRRKDILKEHGVPTKRGILLYGPPGTGKTYACRYMASQLSNVTKIFITGSNLANVTSIFSVAKLFAPSVIFLEDVDLMFTSRDINIYSTSLGDLMDQMDGLQPNEDLSIVLTTNSIDRLEAAIKDRPGRISQCIYMGAPDDELRKTFILHQLSKQNIKKLNISTLVSESNGTTNAFIKEWIFRSIQIGTERLTKKKQKLVLQNSDFNEAMNEMKNFVEGKEAGIIGFRSKI